MYKELELIIQDFCLGSRDNVDDAKHDILTKEINAHLNGEKRFKDLSPQAKRIFHVWEAWREETNYVASMG